MLKRMSTDAVTVRLEHTRRRFVALGQYSPPRERRLVTFSPPRSAPLTAALPYGIVRLLVGVSFSLGLILVRSPGGAVHGNNSSSWRGRAAR